MLTLAGFALFIIWFMCVGSIGLSVAFNYTKD